MYQSLSLTLLLLLQEVAIGETYKELLSKIAV